MSARVDRFQAALFDKDGTLFDFRRTWDSWAADFLPSLCGGKADVLDELCAAVGFDLAKRTFLPSSIAIAASNLEIAEVMAQALKRTDVDALNQEIARSAALAPVSPAVPLAPLLEDLGQRGLKLGVMTNDAHSVADSHLRSAGVREHFDFVCGSDSGFGAKPDPAPLLAFCDHVRVDPFNTIMVGDSTHDLEAARAAGMIAIGVLTGVARASELAPHADAVLSDIGQLPEWLAGQSARK
ncbi:HAD family hydrolase [Planktotalea sp.]|uniref:HAD family hydrolase n=1 Tax=Planktotalea sp. TaxID=2029877 RepID=UPI003D6B7E10